MAPNLSKLSLLLITAVSALFGGSALGYPHHQLRADNGLLLRGENTLATTSSLLPTLSQSVGPCYGSTCATATSSSSFGHVCNAIYAKLSTADADIYAVICDVDFPGQNIYPFILASSFDECKKQCEVYNTGNHDNKCAGFIFAPDRVQGADDCYLKSALNYPMSATVHLVGATIKPSATSASASSATSSANPTDGLVYIKDNSSSIASATPAVATVKELGASTNKPTNQYVSHPPAAPMKLASNLLKPGINVDLVTKYPMAADTGAYSSSLSLLKPKIATMKTTPKLSRDGGKGGMINGTHIVVFCDTGVTSDGQLVSLVSSSVATDNSMNGLYGQSLELVDSLGEWQDDVGRMRGFAPMTEGEEAFNTAMSGSGYRYAIWPESSPILLNSTYALMYASIIYDNVDMNTQQYELSSLGNTLLVVQIDYVYGPTGDRVIAQLFKQGEITYGSLGGFRAWGEDGPGKEDGEIFLFGQVPGGVFVAKTLPSAYQARESYSYWDGHAWGTTIPDKNNKDALILNEPVKDFEVIYAPFFKTFLMVYLTNMADNTFYYRYCQPQDIVPPYESGGRADYAEAIKGCNWTDRRVLYTVPEPDREFVYAGGVHAGYYGGDDIVSGGRKMMISWTEKTGQDANSPNAGYAHKTAYVDWLNNTVAQCPNC